MQGPGIAAPQTAIYLPDTAGIMAPAASLHFNDAPWLAEGSGLRLAHPDIPTAVAERLGSRSLRYQHQVPQLQGPPREQSGCHGHVGLHSCLWGLCRLQGHVIAGFLATSIRDLGTDHSSSVCAAAGAPLMTRAAALSPQTC